jgi:hypothetical protein
MGTTEVKLGAYAFGSNAHKEARACACSDVGMPTLAQSGMQKREGVKERAALELSKNLHLVPGSPSFAGHPQLG